jgi:hypothetical protein
MIVLLMLTPMFSLGFLKVPDSCLHRLIPNPSSTNKTHRLGLTRVEISSLLPLLRSPLGLLRLALRHQHHPAHENGSNYALDRTAPTLHIAGVVIQRAHLTRFARAGTSGVPSGHDRLRARDQ